MSRRAALWVGLAWGAVARPLAAQEIPGRAAISAYRDSLAQVTDPAALRAIVEAERRHRSPADREFQRMRLGWALIRLAQLTDSAPPAVDAATQFYEAGVRRRTWPEAWYGLGAAKTVLDGLGVREVRSAHQPAGNGWRQGAILAYLDALKLDPDFRAAAIEAAKLTLRDEEVVVRPGLGPAIERSVRLAPDDPLGWFLPARLQRRLDQDTAAAESYGRALALGGPTRGLAALELARELFWIGRPDRGNVVYYEGADAPDTDAVAAYRKDLATIAPAAVLAEWDSLAPAARPGWLREFWRRREAESGRPAGTRLPTHARRWRMAYERYRLIPAWTRQYQFGMPFRSGNDEIDDRGVIYIRHGDPDQLIPHFGGEGQEPAESWVYRRSDGDMIFHFKLAQTSPRQPAVSGWRAVESIFAIDNVRVLADLIEVDPMYMGLYLASQGGSASEGRESPVKMNERQFVLASLARATTTDSDPLRFTRRLTPIIQAYGVGGSRAGQGRLLVVWAVSGRDAPQASPLGENAGLVYAIRTRVYVNDSAGHVVASLDTIRRFRTSAPLQVDAYLSGAMTLDVPAGIIRTQVMLSDSAERQGGLIGISGIPVPEFAGAPEMSDLVLGLEGQPIFWDRGGSRFSLNPRNAWTTAEAMEIGFELGGIAPGTPYKVRLGIGDIGADSTTPPKASVEFENQASGGREFVTQSLVLRTLRPGRYLLTATVIIGDTVLRREKRITVVQAR